MVAIQLAKHGLTHRGHGTAVYYQGLGSVYNRGHKGSYLIYHHSQKHPSNFEMCCGIYRTRTKDRKTQKTQKHKTHVYVYTRCNYWL